MKSTIKSTILLALLVSHGLQFISAAGLRVEARDIDLGESDYQCPDGLYVAPHETQCNLYYICSAGGTPTHLYQCRDDLLFDLQYSGCNYKELVDCGDRVPFTCPSPNGNFPVKEGACDSNYYVCTNGVAMKDTCPDGGIFDASLSSCAAPGMIICPTTTTVTPRTTPPRITPGPFECPESNGYFSSPYSCSQFYICQDGTPILNDCPAGLYYNALLNICDWPNNVDCKIPNAF
ncbi:chondroitin proteoglycan 2-like [Daphnia pulex]|uniref:chondroitin proteoglycan 2-like n=1 Tax=Daphnia pulex TaxID=6669 RepID=UPI001EDFCEE1|nr:chondroitin proteoglycan 2-like [Daphnia pulex]